MESLLRTLGWGLIRVLISAMVGVGVGMFILGQTPPGNSTGSPYHLPTPGLFDSIGYGLLTGAAMLLLLFVPGWVSKGPPAADTVRFFRLLSGLGNGCIKLLVCGLAGGGTACMLIAREVVDNPDAFASRGVPSPIYTGTGAGLIVAAVMLVLLFVVPWLFHGPSEGAPPLGS